MSERPRVVVVAGARPNFMKVAPVMEALVPEVEVELVHSGQHYDWLMSASVFADLGLPAPDVNLEVGSGTHAEQTAGVMVSLERHLSADQPNAVVVVGDVNSTLAAAVTAAKLGIPIAHVEAGLRSRDWTMPEEINRVLTDRVSTWLFTPSKDADENLRAEGVEEERIHLVGNVMVDSLMKHLPAARARLPRLREQLDIGGGYGLVTIHRPSNVDTEQTLRGICEALNEISEQLPLLFPAHPRTWQRLDDSGIEMSPGVRIVLPLSYLDFLSLMSGAGLMITDSGGIQEETTVLGVPCVTVRENTERPITCELGTNLLAGTERSNIVRMARQALDREEAPVEVPLWDGKAGERVARVLIEDLTGSGMGNNELTGEAI